MSPRKPATAPGMGGTGAFAFRPSFSRGADGRTSLMTPASQRQIDEMQMQAPRQPCASPRLSLALPCVHARS